MASSNNFSWSDEYVKQMIKRRIETHSMFTGKRGSAVAGWQYVAGSLNNGATAQQCRKKWENLLQKYRDIVTGLDIGEPVSISWPFYEDLHEFVTVNQCVKPEHSLKQDQSIVTVHMPRLLLKQRRSSSPSQTSMDVPALLNASMPSVRKKCKVEPTNIPNITAFQESDFEYSDVDEISVHSVPEDEQVPVIVEISEPACAATSRKLSRSSEYRCPASSNKRARVSDVCEDLAAQARGASRTASGKEQHKQALETLQMEHRMRKNVLQVELEMTKRILQVELDIRQEELDFHRSYHRLKLRQLAQSMQLNS